MSWKTVKEQLQKTLKALLPQRYTGWVGWPDGTVVKPNRLNYVCCVMQDGTPVEAWNDGVPPIAKLQVDLYTDPDYPGLLRARQPRLSFNDDFPYVSINFHRYNHAWPGPDTVPVELRQFMPLHPSVNGFVLTIRAGWLKTSNGWIYFAGGTLDLSTNKPVTGARFVLVAIDHAGALTTINGDIASGLFDLDATDIPILPAGLTPVCIVRLYAGQTVIHDQADNTDLIDIRLTTFGGDASTAIWGGITGDLEDQTDLYEVLGEKLEDAPVDGTLYGRKNGEWDEVVFGGDVTGPAGANDGSLAGFDGSTGKILKDLGHVVTDFIRQRLPGTINMGAAPDSSPDGVTRAYVTDKTMHNVTLRGYDATPMNGAIRINTLDDPDTLQIYMRDAAWFTVMYDMTVAHGDFRHIPLTEPIFIWRGDSVGVGLNGQPIIQEYKVSMGAYPGYKIIDGGTF